MVGDTVGDTVAVPVLIENAVEVELSSSRNTASVEGPSFFQCTTTTTTTTTAVTTDDDAVYYLMICLYE